MFQKESFDYKENDSNEGEFLRPQKKSELPLGKALIQLISAGSFELAQSFTQSLNQKTFLSNCI